METTEPEDVIETDEVLAEILLNQTNIKANQEEQYKQITGDIYVE